MSNPELVRISRVRAFENTKLYSPEYEGNGLQLMVYEPTAKTSDNEDFSSDKLEVNIEVLNMDTLEAAKLLVTSKFNPLVLCYADDRLPGGFVNSGAGAQEEEIWRRTNIVRIMEKESAVYYPLKWNELLLIDRVTIYKDTKYKNMNSPFEADILNAVALRSPAIADENYAESKSLQMMDDKIGAIFKAAIKNGNDSLVLGAFGCGSFSNPPKAVAKLFKKYTIKFQNRFRRIIFAIIGSNYSVFKDILSN